MGLRLDWGKSSLDNRHSVPTHIPIPGPTLPVAGRGGGSNTTHALLSPDPESLPIEEGDPRSQRRVPENQGTPRRTNSNSPCSLNGGSQLSSEPGMKPRHYPLGVGS